MKSILTEWRKYVKNSDVITIDESQMTPKFLSRLLNENDSLPSSDIDPESPSVEDLEKQSPEFFKSQMDEMIRFEDNTEKLMQRIQNDRTLKNTLNLVNHDIDAVKSDMEDEPGMITNIFDWAKSVTNSILGTDFKSSKENMRLKQKELESKKTEVSVKFRDALVSVYNPYQREIFRAIQLFTGANYEQIRHPDTFDPAKAQIFDFVNDGVRDIFMPSKETYVKAKIILRKLSESKLDKPIDVYRGIAIGLEDSNFPGLKSYSVGSKIELKDLSSFSIDKSVALNFLQNNVEESTGKFGLLMTVPQLSVGVDVDPFSEFEGVETEIIVYGTFRITKMEYISYNSESVQNMEFNNVQELLKDKSPEEIEMISENGYVLATMERINE